MNSNVKAKLSLGMTVLQSYSCCRHVCSSDKHLMHLCFLWRFHDLYWVDAIDLSVISLSHYAFLHNECIDVALF